MPKPKTPTQIVLAVCHEIANERCRQVTQEHFDTAHDDAHADGSLAMAASCYAMNAATWASAAPHLESRYRDLSPKPQRWPWLEKWWKPRNQRRDLVRAAALIVAEIERLDRAADRP
jgi:hypothetical protein